MKKHPENILTFSLGLSPPGLLDAEDDPSFSSSASFSASADQARLQIMLEEEADQRLDQLRARDLAVRQLESDIVDVNAIFKDLASMVHEQGDLVDTIEENVEVTSIKVEEGTDQLRQAEVYQSKARKKKLILGGILLVVVIIVVVISIILLCLLLPIGIRMVKKCSYGTSRTFAEPSTVLPLQMESSFPAKTWEPSPDAKDSTCAICLDDFKEDSQVRELTCAHVFHVNCIDSWAVNRFSCPLCKRSMDSTVVQDLDN